VSPFFLCHLTIYIKKKMAITTPLAYNPSLSPITGTNQVGKLAVGVAAQDYSIDPGGVKWWMGPDEEDGYVIAVPVSGNTQPTPISGVTASVGFFKSTSLTDNSFIQLTDNQFNQSFSSATEASVWLTTNGYWNSYLTPILYLDAGDFDSYPGTGSVWTDLVAGKQFNLNNGPSYSSGSGGILNFNANLSQFAQCNTSLPNLNVWSVDVWHYYTGSNTGTAPCIVTEVFPGSTSNINYSLGDNNGGFTSGFFDGGWRVTTTYTLTPNNWYNIVGTYDGNTLNMYVNNTLVATDYYSGAPISSQGGIRLMRRWDLDDYWGGSLATVGIYDQALTPGQVTKIYNDTKSRYGL
jgi:hypothetical protein